MTAPLPSCPLLPAEQRSILLVFDRAVAAQKETFKAAGFSFFPFFFRSLHSRLALSLCSCSYLCVHLPVSVMMRPDIPHVQECLNEAGSGIVQLDNGKPRSSLFWLKTFKISRDCEERLSPQSVSFIIMNVFKLWEDTEEAGNPHRYWENMQETHACGGLRRHLTRPECWRENMVLKTSLFFIVLTR